MITILMHGPAGAGKSKLARLIYRLIDNNGFFAVRIFTVNNAIVIPADAVLEEKE